MTDILKIERLSDEQVTITLHPQLRNYLIKSEALIADEPIIITEHILRWIMKEYSAGKDWADDETIDLDEDDLDEDGTIIRDDNSRFLLHSRIHVFFHSMANCFRNPT